MRRKPCDHCGRKFFLFGKRHLRYCSPECGVAGAQAARRAKHTTWLDCYVCDVAFQRCIVPGTRRPVTCGQKECINEARRRACAA